MIDIKILNQGNVGACVTYAIAGLANFYLTQKGIQDEIDPLAFFNAVERGGGTTIIKALFFAKGSGLPSKNGKIYKVKDFGVVMANPGGVENALAVNQGLILGYAIHQGRSFADRLQNFSLTANDDAHTMIITGADPKNYRFRIANSWGENFGDKGYFWLPYPLLNQCDTKGIYSFSLDI